MSLQRLEKASNLDISFAAIPGRATVDEVELRELSKSMADQFAKSLIRQGWIDPRNKSEDEIERDAASYMAEIVEGRVSLVFVTDHRDDLSAKAREFLNVGELDLACCYTQRGLNIGLMVSSWLLANITGCLDKR